MGWPCGWGQGEEKNSEWRGKKVHTAGGQATSPQASGEVASLSWACVQWCGHGSQRNSRVRVGGASAEGGDEDREHLEMGGRP